MNKVLLFFSLKYNGNWDQIYDALDKKEKIDREWLDEVELKIDSKYITILDHEYPNNLRLSYKPPFVLFYKGDIKLLKKYYKTVAFICETVLKETSENKVKEICAKIHNQNNIILTAYDYCSSDLIVNECLTKNWKLICVLKSSLKEKFENHKSLKEVVLKDGLVISEYYEKFNNIQKDKICFSLRIFSGLSKSFLYFATQFNEIYKLLVNYSSELENEIHIISENYELNELNILI